MNFAAEVGDYRLQANDEILVILQTESPAGIANAEEIYSLPGCDAIFIGPNDLQFQMRQEDGTFPTPAAHEAAIQEVIQIGKKTNCPTGIHCMDPESALQRAEQGMQFIAVESDLKFLTSQATAALKIVYPDHDAGDVVRY